MTEQTLAAPITATENSGLSPSSIIRAWVVASAFSLMLNGAIPQLEIYITGGQVPVPYSSFRLVLMVAFLSLILFRGGRLSASTFSGVSLGLLIYLAADWIYLSQIGNADMGEVLYGYWLTLSPVLLVFGASLVTPDLPHRLVIRCLYIISLAVACLAIWQLLTNSPVLATSSSDGHFQVTQSYSPNGGGVRPFSLFSSSLDLGIFATFMASITVATRARGTHRMIQILGALAFIGLCLITKNRTTYVMCAFAIFTAVLLRRDRRSLIAAWSPLLALGFSVALLVPVLTRIGSVGSGVSDPASMIARLREWRYFMEQFFSFGDLIFGKGIVQGSKVGSLIPIDNLFIAIFLQIGVGGLIVLTSSYIAIWRQLLSRASWRRPLSVGAAAVWAAVPIGGMTNLVLTTCAGYCLLEFCCSPRASMCPRQGELELLPD